MENSGNPVEASGETFARTTPPHTLFLIGGELGACLPPSEDRAPPMYYVAECTGTQPLTVTTIAPNCIMDP
jgi:hypothetical protein